MEPFNSSHMPLDSRLTVYPYLLWTLIGADFANYSLLMGDCGLPSDAESLRMWLDT